MMVTNNHNIPPHAANNGKVTDNKHEATDEGADGVNMSDDGCDTGTIGDSDSDTDSDTDENVKKVDTNPK